MIKCLIFDFDGVIAESVDVKTEAFGELFKDYPQHLKNITDYHLANGGMSRFDKFRHIYKNILKEQLSDDKFSELCRRFKELVAEKVVNSPYVKGARELLDSCLGRYVMFVVSGTPEDEIKMIVHRRGLEKYFSDVYGSPETKTELIKKIIRNGFAPREAVFVGDSINDYSAAIETGIYFIARSADKNASWPDNVKIVSKFDNFINVENFLNKLKELN